MDKTHIKAFGWLIAMGVLLAGIFIMSVLYLFYWLIAAATKRFTSLVRIETRLKQEE